MKQIKKINDVIIDDFKDVGDFLIWDRTEPTSPWIIMKMPNQKLDFIPIRIDSDELKLDEIHGIISNKNYHDFILKTLKPYKLLIKNSTAEQCKRIFPNINCQQKIKTIAILAKLS